jgi:hypothetical protein
MPGSDRITFSASVELGGKTATGIEVPPDVVEALGTSKRPAVNVTIGGHTYRTTVAVMGGRFLIPLSAENRSAANVAAGDQVDVAVQLDTEPREVAVPPDFARALAKNAAAQKRFETLSYSHRRRWVLSIEGAKTDDTRQRRITKAVADIAAG